MAFVLVAALLLAGCNSGRLVDRVTSPGSAAHDLVSAKAYPKLLLEIDSPSGYGPDATALQTLTSALAQVTHRDASAILVDDSDTSIPVDTSKKYSQGEIQSLENEHRSRHSSGDTAVLYILYVAGGSDADTSAGQVLGAAYHGTSIVMFKGNILANSDDGFLSTKPYTRNVERAVLVHETGHAMGLVNLGAPMQRDHEDHADGADGQHHSANKNSVMYYLVESSRGLLDVVNRGNDIPYQYDSDDAADLGALGAS